MSAHRSKTHSFKETLRHRQAFSSWLNVSGEVMKVRLLKATTDDEDDDAVVMLLSMEADRMVLSTKKLHRVGSCDEAFSLLRHMSRLCLKSECTTTSGLADS